MTTTATGSWIQRQQERRNEFGRRGKTTSNSTLETSQKRGPTQKPREKREKLDEEEKRNVSASALFLLLLTPAVTSSGRRRRREKSDFGSGGTALVRSKQARSCVATTEALALRARSCVVRPCTSSLLLLLRVCVALKEEERRRRSSVRR